MKQLPDVMFSWLSHVNRSYGGQKKWLKICISLWNARPQLKHIIHQANVHVKEASYSRSWKNRALHLAQWASLSNQPSLTHKGKWTKTNPTRQLLPWCYYEEIATSQKPLWDKFQLTTARMVFGQFVARKELLYAYSCRHSDSISTCLNTWSSLSGMRLIIVFSWFGPSLH